MTWLSPRRLLLIAIPVIWLAAVAGLLTGAARDLRAAEAAADRAGRAAGVEMVTEGHGVDDLAAARARFRRGGARLDSIVLAPLRVLPVVGRHLESARSLAGAGEAVAATGERALSRAGAAIDRAGGGPAERVEAIRDLEAIAAQADRDLGRVDLGPSRALAGPLARRRDQFAQRLAEVRRVARHGRDAAGTARRFLAGPQRYLVLAANNGEMRAGSGMFLSVGVVETEMGTLKLSEMIPAGEAKVDPPATAPGDLQELWGFVGLGGDWRMLGMSPRFDATARLAADMWRARTGQAVDGVLALDVIALRAVVEATGPVTVAGRELAGDDLARFVLHDQYVELRAAFGDPQSERRDALAALARTALERVGGPGVDVAALGEGLVGAARGRHLLAWSPDGAAQRGWEAAGVAGTLDPSSLLLSLVNRGGNKLDQFLRVDSAMQVGDGAVSVEVAVENRAPARDVPYVLGPNPEIDLPAGTWVGFVTLTVPGWVTESAVVSEDTCPVVRSGADGPARVIACQLVLGRGERAVVGFRFGLPEGQRSVRIEASARVPATTWRVPGRRAFRDTRPRRVELEGA